jgi:hypothetical protein
MSAAVSWSATSVFDLHGSAATWGGCGGAKIGAAGQFNTSGGGTIGITLGFGVGGFAMVGGAQHTWVIPLVCK